MKRKGCESIIPYHDCDLWVTMVGLVNVPYSDWGDFRRRRAVNISSLISFFLPEASFGLWILSLPVSVSPSVRHEVCSRDNSLPVQARITKFGP